MVLTQKQREDLHKAILEYLHLNNFEQVGQIFEEQTGIQYDPNEKKKQTEMNILEKKWTSISRLQKQILDYKKQVDELQQQINDLQRNGPMQPAQNMMIQKPNKGISKEDMYNPSKKLTHSLHKASITKVAMHKQWQWVASSSEDGSVKIYDYEQGMLEASLRGHSGVINSVQFDHTGSHIVTSSSDMTLKIFELNQFKCIKTLQGHDHSVSYGEFNLDNDKVISCSRDKTIKVWDVQSGYCKHTLEGHEDWVRYVKYSQNGKKIASCSNDQSIIIWDSTNYQIIQHIQEAHDNVIECVTWCGQSLQKSNIIGGNNNNKDEQDQENKQEEEQDENSIQSKKSQLLEKLKQKKNEAKVVISEEELNKYLLSCSRDKSIKLWNTVTGELVHTFLGSDNWVKQTVLHPYLPYMYSASDDKSIRVWSLLNGKQIKKIQKAHDHFVQSIDISGSQMMLATGGSDKTVVLWKLGP